MSSSLGRRFVIGGVLLVAVVAVAVLAMRPKHGAAGGPGAPDVQVVPVEQKDVPIYGEWIGTLDGLT